MIVVVACDKRGGSARQRLSATRSASGATGAARAAARVRSAFLSSNETFAFASGMKYMRILRRAVNVACKEEKRVGRSYSYVEVL